MVCYLRTLKCCRAKETCGHQVSKTGNGHFTPEYGRATREKWTKGFHMLNECFSLTVKGSVLTIGYYH